VAAAELPQMSGAIGTADEINAALRKRLERGLRQISFFVVPTVTAFIFIGRVLVAALYQTGDFHSDDSLYVWYILIGSTFGLLAVTLGRLYSSAFYALRDPKTPLRFAMVRVTLTAILGLLFAFPLRPYIIDLIVLLHMPLPNLPEGPSLLGVIGLTASAGMAGWIEFAMLRRALARRIGSVKLAPSFLGRLWISGLFAAITGVACHLYLAPLITPHLPFRHISEAILVAGAFGVVYFGAAITLGVGEARATLQRFTRR
jgi:putative peptidoglycan lipid II flippase